MKTYCIGDIHGCYDKFMKCLEAVNFSDSDTLIQLGDVVDRGSDSYSCIKALLKIKNLIAIKGNHDEAWYEYLIDDAKMSMMWKHGAQQTLNSYKSLNIDPKIHKEFFEKQILYYLDEDLNLFIHGGFNRHEFIELQDPDIFTWDRDLLNSARSHSTMENQDFKANKFKIKGCEKGKFKEIFLGHTPTQYFGSGKPLNYFNIWDLDTGAGKLLLEGTVTIMDIETKEYFQF